MGVAGTYGSGHFYILDAEWEAWEKASSSQEMRTKMGPYLARGAAKARNKAKTLEAT